ncbi:MAG: regulator SirB [Candidatus Dactylopiibacterium carminicum]|uniref:Regulator SirB n=1 Tax=Candidatus Dactylopiibacterium carminicum TaxID=857335 RepID=A0A272EQB1_9RHOO|nr:SirB2 family protein [Candidatus Dactylopiibacterium carminicum]KAF7598521.1 regulator SirB [Candidatus Dactylopiibacterium carminicum]PAS92246.1 MAG: regulator SirB [Candidatus Dactylopiibacterium carminicum]PAS95762.1 MAG: regulator SirB [Candidatus Dactylopiibacterium carminicum]PAS98009.1 MAG: regulator SirB [Candidatus Dactylopiibacterium carminicum]
MLYLTLKQIHFTAAMLSIGLFFLRGSLQLAGVPWRRWWPLRYLPHLVDTVLLGVAIKLAVLIHQYPLVHGWLTAKLVALLGYILLGHWALRRDQPRRRAVAAFISALLCVGYIVGVGLTKSASWRLL